MSHVQSSCLVFLFFFRVLTTGVLAWSWWDGLGGPVSVMRVCGVAGCLGGWVDEVVGWLVRRWGGWWGGWVGGVAVGAVVGGMAGYAPREGGVAATWCC